MNKNSFNLKRTKLASKKPFRLEEDILLSASDRHSDHYRIIITARPLRDRYNVHLVMSHEPSQKTVYSKTWLFSSMENCWDRFHSIVDITRGVRDFVETEGIQTVTAQYMLKHNLNSVASEIEDIYETAIPYIQNVTDESSRGNLLRNHPLVPTLVQSGPDSLADVYKSCGTFENPVPKNLPKAKSSHKEAIRPMSGFQAEALKAGIPLARVASSGHNKSVKTANEQDPIETLMRSVREQSKSAVQKTRELAIQRCLKAGIRKEEAERLYDTIRENSNPVLSIEIPLNELAMFLAEGLRLPVTDPSKFNSRRAKEMSHALKLGFCPTKASLRMWDKVKPGTIAVSFPAEFGRAILTDGGLDRILDPDGYDYSPDAMDRFCSPEYAKDRYAASAIMSATDADLAGGPDNMVKRMLSGTDFGCAEAFLVDALEPQHVLRLVCATDEDIGSVRNLMDAMGKILPIDRGEPLPNSLDLPKEPCPKKCPDNLHFQVGDRVAPKSRLNNPSLKGDITDVTDGRVSVQWEDGQRHIYDMAEALMRLMTLPGPGEPIDGMIVYQLPGMDEETVLTLNAMRIDPVTVHAIVSHCMPPSKSAKGWQETLLNSFSKIGITLKDVSGFVYTDQKEAFAPRTWFEANLPAGQRLVIDIEGPVIRAGAVDDYIPPKRKIVME